MYREERKYSTSRLAEHHHEGIKEISAAETSTYRGKIDPPTTVNASGADSRRNIAYSRDVSLTFWLRDGPISQPICTLKETGNGVISVAISSTFPYHIASLNAFLPRLRG